MSTKTLIIPAAGSGSRMQKETPKPYLQLSGCTILEHTIQRFLSLDGLEQVLVPSSEEYVPRTQELLDKLLPDNLTGHALAGGEQRQHSIHNALSKVADVDLVLVHDAVRPFVKPAHIQSCCKAASEVGGAVLGIPSRDTIKQVDGQKLIRETPHRDELWQAQTPQVFQKELILEAYQKASDDNFTGTDDSSLVERLDKQVKMVEGDRSNFKITYPLDLKLAQLLIEKKQS